MVETKTFEAEKKSEPMRFRSFMDLVTIQLGIPACINLVTHTSKYLTMLPWLGYLYTQTNGMNWNFLRNALADTMALGLQTYAVYKFIQIILNQSEQAF